jgi:coenzyme PQQ precursor peptide PqqA
MCRVPCRRKQQGCADAVADYTFQVQQLNPRGSAMAWTTPTLVEICIGLEINGYLPAEF